MARIRVKEDEFSIEMVAKKVRGESPAIKSIKKTPSAPTDKKKLPNVPIHTLRIILLVCFSLGLGMYASSLHAQREDLRREVAKLKTDPAIVARQQNEALLAKVSRLLEIPQQETPTIADVTNAEQAKQQDTFYKDAQNGDKVLFYIQAGKAVLYRPTTDKIINTTALSQPGSQ